MDTFSIRDIRLRSGDLVKDAEAGKLSVVTKHGKPLFVAVPLDEMLLNFGVHTALAVHLYQEGHFTLSKAAKFANTSIESLIEILDSLNFPIIDYPADQLQDEVEQMDQYLKNRKKSS